MRFKDLKQELIEGVYDPGIFKAFFLAGGAGSGKSYSAEKATGSAAGKFQWHEKMEDNLTPGKVGPYGLKVVNSDEQLEYGLLKAKMSSNMKAYTDDETTKKELRCVLLSFIVLGLEETGRGAWERKLEEER